MVVHAATGFPCIVAGRAFHALIVSMAMSSNSGFKGQCAMIRSGFPWASKKTSYLREPPSLFFLASSEYGRFGQYVGFRRVPPASVKALVRAKPFSEEHLNAGLPEITSPGHSRDFPALDLSSSLNGTAKFHFAASLASPRRRRLSLKSSASSEGDTSPVMISFAPSCRRPRKQ